VNFHVHVGHCLAPWQNAGTASPRPCKNERAVLWFFSGGRRADETARHVDQIAPWRKTDRTTPRPSTRVCGAARREISATLVSAINPNAVMAD
jgi:hypothetical protein